MNGIQQICLYLYPLFRNRTLNRAQAVVGSHQLSMITLMLMKIALRSHQSGLNQILLQNGTKHMPKAYFQTNLVMGIRQRIRMMTRKMIAWDYLARGISCKDQYHLKGERMNGKQHPHMTYSRIIISNYQLKTILKATNPHIMNQN